MATDAEKILEKWSSDGIEFVRFELPDMHGTSRSKLIPIEHAAGYAEGGLNMYGGAGVLDTRSDVVRRHALQRGGRLRRPASDPGPRDGGGRPLGRRHRRASSATRCGTTAGRSPRCRGTSSGASSTAAAARLRADARLRAGVLPPRRRDEGAPLRGLPHLQHGPEHVRAVRPGARRAAAGARPRRSSPRTASTRARSGRSTSPRRTGMAGPDAGLHVQERGQGARAPERLLRDVHVEAVLRTRPARACTRT